MHCHEAAVLPEAGAADRERVLLYRCTSAQLDKAHLSTVYL